MNVWRDSILILAVLGIFLFGFYLMTKLDKYLCENRKMMEEEEEKCKPSCIMLDTKLSDEEIVEEIQQFRNEHEKSCVLLYDRTNIDICDTEKIKKNSRECSIL